MSIRLAGKIVFALLFSVLAGFTVRSLIPQYDDCTASALDAVLAGGELTLADDCVLMLDYERIVTGDVTVTGGMLHGGGLQRVLRIAPDATLTLRHVEVRVGVAELEPKDGGGIYNEGTLHLIDSHMAGNRATRGGAIYNAGTGIFFVRRLTITAQNRMVVVFSTLAPCTLMTASLLAIWRRSMVMVLSMKVAQSMPVTIIGVILPDPAQGKSLVLMNPLIRPG